MAEPTPDPRRLCVIIPAHNEAAVIGDCLRAVNRAQREAHDALSIETVVVANGCTDDTVRVAREHGARVLELETPGKAGALNAGDAASDVFPRLYLDADIVLTDGAIPALAEALDTEAAVMAAPSPRFDTTGAPWSSRAYYRVFAELPYATEGLGGVGVYGVSRAGRARWGAFPPVRGDDLFVQRHFSPQEKIRVRGRAIVKVPRTTAALLAVRTRVAAGNTDLARGAAETATSDLSTSTRDTLGSIVRLTQTRPSFIPAAAVYLAITLEARRRARRTTGHAWHRDDSTR